MTRTEYESSETLAYTWGFEDGFFARAPCVDMLGSALYRAGLLDGRSERPAAA